MVRCVDRYLLWRRIRRPAGSALSRCYSVVANFAPLRQALDCLKADGFESDPQVSKGMDYLISSQFADGAWVEDEDDAYTAYHSAWTGIDGLREYRFHGMVKKLPGNQHPARPQ